MKNLGNFILSCIVIYGFSSCAGSKKIDFETAYKFSTYTYQGPIDETENSKDYVKDVSDLVVSIEKDRTPEFTADISDFEQEMYRKIGVSADERPALNMEEMKIKVQHLNWKEKRDLRKSIKKELKHLNLKAGHVYSTMDAQQVNQISEMTRWSIIIGSVGLVLLILGAIFTTGILTFFGAIFVVGAAVLFILDQV